MILIEHHHLFSMSDLKKKAKLLNMNTKILLKRFYFQQVLYCYLTKSRSIKTPEIYL